VASVEAILKNDWLRVHYDPKQQTTEQLLAKVSELGFQAKVVAASPGNAAP
jgi:hypothetical protein